MIFVLMTTFIFFWCGVEMLLLGAGRRNAPWVFFCSWGGGWGALLNVHQAQLRWCLHARERERERIHDLYPWAEGSGHSTAQLGCSRFCGLPTSGPYTAVL